MTTVSPLYIEYIGMALPSWLAELTKLKGE